MSVKQFNNVRLNLKHDTEQKWLQTNNFIPNKGEAIVYDKDETYAYPRLKIGDGETNVNDLPFISGGQADWEQNDENGSGYIKNRTHYEISPEISIEWSGVPYDNDYTYVHNIATRLCAVKISDEILTREQLLNGATFNGYNITDWEIHIPQWSLEEPIKGIFVCGSTDADGITISNYWFLCASKENSLYLNPGTYALTYDVHSTLQANIYVSGSIKALDRKYISYIPGENVEGKTFNLSGTPTVAKQGAEIFNDYTNNIATGSYSHAEGYSTKATGEYAHAEGYFTSASRSYSHAEGGSTSASAGYAHAEGYSTTASGNYSHAEGYGVKTTASASHAEGCYTEARGTYQHVQGKYNITDSNGTYAHIVGNGTSTAKRSNAHTLDWNGNAWFAGNVYVKGTSQSNGSVLATKSYVDEHATVDESRLWSKDDRNIFSNVTSENYVNNNGAIKLFDAGNSPIKNLIVTAKEKTNKVYLTICGKNIANINKKVENTPSLSGGAVLPAVLPFTLGDFSGEINSSSILPQYLPFGLNVDNKTNNILLPVGKIFLYINEGYKFSVNLLKNNTSILRKDLITELLIDNSDNKYDEMQVSFDSDDIDKVKFMAEIGETATGYEPYRGYSVVYETSFTAGETVDLTDELQNFNTVYGVTNVISNCNVSFDYNQLKETSTNDWLYSKGGKVITTLATKYESGLMSKEDKNKLDNFTVATDEDIYEMLLSIGIIENESGNFDIITDENNNEFLI